MSKRRGPEERKAIDPEDVLAGRARVNAVELLDLIHRVNPTGRELGAREEEIRYVQKSRLQSLLVRRFAAELDVVEDPEHEGTVSILHRGHGRDGCHAVLDTLDEDARAWVRLQLDLGPREEEEEGPKVPAARPSGRGREEPARGEEDWKDRLDEATPGRLLRLAEEAALAYDYEGARALLERAVLGSGGAVRPAAALLALLVETLGDDAGALDLQRSLSREALADPDVRALLALAEARAGDAAQAVAFLRGATGPRVAEVLAALGAGAAAAGDAERAAGHLAELRKRDPAHPAIVGLGDEVAKLRAAARGPSEAELASLVASGHEGEAEKKAAEVLSRWPESEAARRVLKAAEERRRAAHEAAERRAREALLAEQAKREAERVDQVRARLAGPDPREGLLAWLDLDPALRKRADEGRAAELTRWLDLTPAKAASRARVDAVMALAAARGRLSADPQGVLLALSPHEATLERVPEARRIVREAHAEIDAMRSSRARQEVEAARRDLSGGDAAAALARLEAQVLRDLGEEERAQAEALRAEAARIVGKDKRVADVGRLRQGGHLFEARALAEEILAEAGEGEKGRWEEERRAIQEAIQRMFLVEVHRDGRPFGEGPVVDAEQTMMDPPVWLTEDGRTMVIGEGHERWAWVQIVDVPSWTVRADVVLRAPEAIGNIFPTVLGSTAWLVSARGALIALDLDRLEVTLLRRGNEMLPAGWRTGAVALPVDRDAPDLRHYWVMPADAEGYGAPMEVFDLELRRVVREVPDVMRMQSVTGAREGRVACFRPGSPGGVVLHEARGVPVPPGRINVRGMGPVLASVHPSGEGLVLAAVHDEKVHLVSVTPDGTPSAPWLLSALGDGTIVGLATSREPGIVAAMILHPSPLWEVLLVRVEGATFELLHRVAVPDYTAFVRDGAALRLFGFSSNPLALFPLGPDTPAIPPFAPRPDPWIYDLSGTPTCIGSAGPRAKEYKTVQATAKDTPQGALAILSRAIQKENDPDKLVERERSLVGEWSNLNAEAARLREWIFERYPDHPKVRVLRAEDRARHGRWDEVRDLLAPCTAESFGDDEDHVQHLFHLRALASLHLGDVADARRHIAEAATHQGSCQLLALDLFLSPKPRPAEVARGEVKAAPLLSALVWSVTDADALLASGDPEGALATLDPKRFDVGDEVQVLSRRAEAWLRLSPPPGPQRIAKIMALSRLLDANEGWPDSERDELPIPGARWDRARIDDLCQRAAAWLSSLG